MASPGSVEQQDQIAQLASQGYSYQQALEILGLEAGGMTLAQAAQALLGSSQQTADVVKNGTGGYTIPQASAGPPAIYAASGFIPTPTSRFWKGLPDEYKNQLYGLADAFEKLAGYNVKITAQDLENMGHSRVLDLYSMGQYMWGHMSADVKTNMPWLEFGLDSDLFRDFTKALSRSFTQLTGQNASQQLLHDAFAQGFASPRTSPYLAARDWQTFLLADVNMQKAYPWLKYGYDYQTFQSHKAEMKSAFGFDLTDQEAGHQLQYFHAASPDYYAATATQPQKGQSQESIGGSTIAR